MDLSFLKRVPLRQYPWFLNLQFINLLLPLISYPYLLRVLGPEKYGLIAVANSLGAVVLTISEYGYYFIGVKDIVRISANAEHVSKYLSNAMAIRGLLCAICMLIFIPLFIFTSLLYQEYTLTILTFAALLPALLYPHWLFIGLQKIRQLNYIILLIRLLSVGFVFVLITDASDYYIFPLVNLIPSCIGGIVSLWFLSSLGIQINLKKIHGIWHQIREGFYPFISQSLTSLYVNVNPILLMALIQDSVLVGYYAVGSRIVVLTRSIFAPLNQLYLPVISKQFSTSAEKAIKDVKKYAGFVGLISAVGVILLNIFAAQIVILIAGDEYSPAVTVVYLLSPTLLIIALNNLAGVHTLLNLEMKKEFFIGIVTGTIANVVLLLFFAPYFSFQSPALSWTISEIIVLGIFLVYLRKRNLRVNE